MPETASDISAEHKGRPEYQDYRSHKSPAQFYRRIRQFMYAVNLFSLQWSDLQLQPHFTGRSEAALSYSVLYCFSWKAHCLVYSMFYFLRACLETSRAQPKPCSSVVTQPPLWQMEEQLEEPRHCRFSLAGHTWVVCPHIFWGHSTDPFQMFYCSQCLKTLRLTPAGDAVGDCQQDRQVRQVFQLVIIQS